LLSHRRRHGEFFDGRRALDVLLVHPADRAPRQEASRALHAQAAGGNFLGRDLRLANAGADGFRFTGDHRLVARGGPGNLAACLGHGDARGCQQRGEVASSQG
jgi:hypothetical protein